MARTRVFFSHYPPPLSAAFDGKSYKVNFLFVYYNRVKITLGKQIFVLMFLVVLVIETQ